MQALLKNVQSHYGTCYLPYTVKPLISDSSTISKDYGCPNLSRYSVEFMKPLTIVRKSVGRPLR